jgi:membrane-associated protein
MEFILQIASFFLHLDEYLGIIINAVGPLTYVVLFVIVFAETGLVIFPFLPGDSLLFVAGTLSGTGHLNVLLVYFSLLIAAILGDTINYWIGYRVGPKVFSKEGSKFFKKEYLERTREFYEKHGGKTIILARFIPIIRTFAPFVAGIGRMHYRTFLFYNVIGAFLWVTGFVFAGYFFGGLPFIKENFHYTVVIIVFLSILPMLIEYINYKRKPKMTKEQMKHATFEEIEETLHKTHLND